MYGDPGAQLCRLQSDRFPANSAWFYVLAVLAASPYAVETRQRVRRMRSHHESDLPEARADSSAVRLR
jgi:hypothetical protein